ncbi:IS4 family transposase [Ramlibacter cellulosilyticus]|nr:IS4 family transposase [Ramlibacter cellulosilyticus]
MQQVLQGLPRGAFQNAVDKYRGDRHSKGFSCWSHLVAMVYAQLSGVGSLRELEAGFNQHRSQHYHLNTRAVHRTTLADANGKRNPQIFAETLRALIQVARPSLKREGEELLLLLDSTTIALRGRGSQWTHASATRTPGLKLHLLFSSNQQLPVQQTITAANVNDVEEGRKLQPVAGASYVFDKGYCDYSWWNRLDAGGARFVTRLKRNAAVTQVCARAIAEADASQILNDAVVRFTHRSNRGGHCNAYAGLLRRIEVARAGEDSLVLVTNDLEAPAAEIAQLYRQRWEIELFFKWIKQHLRLRRFLGQNENAIRIQILTALIAYVLVAILNAKARHPSLWAALAELRTGLFHRPQQDESWWRRRRQQQEIQTALQPGLFG